MSELSRLLFCHSKGLLSYLFPFSKSIPVQQRDLGLFVYPLTQTSLATLWQVAYAFKQNVCLQLLTSSVLTMRKLKIFAYVDVRTLT
jgi:hypothetical protein